MPLYCSDASKLEKEKEKAQAEETFRENMEVGREKSFLRRNQSGMSGMKTSD